VRDSWGASFHPALQVDGPVTRKGVDGKDGYSGFTVRDPETGTDETTGLAARLTAQSITKVVVVGLALDYCVKATALDAASLGFGTTVLEAATRPVDLEPGDGQRSIVELQQAGVAIV
jgi:nicotinamidase/pyrazinamidase